MYSRHTQACSGTSTQPHAPMSNSPGPAQTAAARSFFEGRECECNCQRRRLQLGRGLSRERRCAAPGSACLDQHPRLRARCRRCLFHPLLHLRRIKNFIAISNQGFSCERSVSALLDQLKAEDPWMEAHPLDQHPYVFFCDQQDLHGFSLLA